MTRATSYTATTASVAASATAVTLAAKDTARLGLTIFNDSTSASLCVRLGDDNASLTDFTARISPGGYYEVPNHYNGKVTGIWTAASGAARVTRLT